MAPPTHITKVAIVGASGNSGIFMTSALLKTGKHTVTALTRGTSPSQLPAGVITKTVDYNKPETLIAALQGQEALIITLSPQAPQETQMQLIHAALAAGVSWILPNEWSPDTANEGLNKDIFVWGHKGTIRKAIQDTGMGYLAISTGFWYEWSLAIPSAFGFDFVNRTVTFFDQGETKISVSTWAQVGNAVASLLSLPIAAAPTNPQGSLEQLRNKIIYISSFTVSQREMLESVKRVTNTKEEDWTISRESCTERYAAGIKEMQGGSRVGFVKMIYTRVFYPDGSGDVESGRGTLNGLLGLPKEDIDLATRAAIERSETSKWVG